MRLATWPKRYQRLLKQDLPLERSEIDRLRAFAPRFAELCGELAQYMLPETIQHDDLHMGNVYASGPRLRVLDWGDSSISHPFVSLVVTFRFLEESNRMAVDDPWFDRLRDAYLEPWGRGFNEAFAAALRLGRFVHAFAWTRQRAFLLGPSRFEFDKVFTVVLRRAIALAHD